jgi:hypothetical protein
MISQKLASLEARIAKLEQSSLTTKKASAFNIREVKDYVKNQIKNWGFSVSQPSKNEIYATNEGSRISAGIPKEYWSFTFTPKQDGIKMDYVTEGLNDYDNSSYDESILFEFDDPEISADINMYIGEYIVLRVTRS